MYLQGKEHSYLAKMLVPLFLLLLLSSCLSSNYTYDEIVKIRKGEYFQPQRGGKFLLLGVTSNKIRLKRYPSTIEGAWEIVEWENVKYHIGNKEYLEIMNKNVKNQYIEIRLSRRSKAYILDF